MLYLTHLYNDELLTIFQYLVLPTAYEVSLDFLKQNLITTHL